MADEPLFQVWRRDPASRGAWHKVPGLAPLEHDAAFQAVLAEERKASFTDWQYALAPVGSLPASGTGAFHRGYRTTRRKPRG